MAKTRRKGIIQTGSGEDFVVETWGELNMMPRNARSVWAIFGMFERTDRGTLQYSMGAKGLDIGECDSHYRDDLQALIEDNIDIADRR